MSTIALLLGVVLLGLVRLGQSLTPMEKVVAANNDFAMDLYAEIKNDPSQAGKNIFISPFSISAALAMIYAGAKGNTKSQMGSVLNLDGVSSVDDGFRQLFDALNNPAHAYTLNVANALFRRETYPFRQAYLDLVSQSYHSLLKSMDFAGAPDVSRRYINKWVADKTNNKILNLLGLGSIDASTMVVVVNAIYFKGLWESPFDTFETLSAPFDMSTSVSVDVDMMNKYMASYVYADLPDLDSQILELPYAGGNVSMYILLPNDVDGLAALEDQLTVAALNDAISSMYETDLDISLPKFKLTQKLDMSAFLKSMGMVDVFDESFADLSGIDSGPSTLSISGIVHKAYVDVSEEGTEAAAATGIMVGAGLPFDPVYFNADHPFLFFIREKVSGSILFSGRLLDPVAEDDDEWSEPDDSTPDIQPSTVPKVQPSTVPSVPPKTEKIKPNFRPRPRPVSPPHMGTVPVWCQSYTSWVCNLYQWLGFRPSKRASSRRA